MEYLVKEYKIKGPAKLSLTGPKVEDRSSCSNDGIWLTQSEVLFQKQLLPFAMTAQEQKQTVQFAVWQRPQ